MYTSIFTRMQQFTSFVIDRTAYGRVQNPIYHVYILSTIFLASFSQNRSTSQPCHRFLRFCLLLTYEQALIEARPGYYYCTRNVRNARAHSSRTHPNREVSSCNANIGSSCSCCESRYDRLPQLRRACRVVFCFIVNSSSKRLQRSFIVLNSIVLSL